jgi:hypothetical protein
MWLLGKVYLSYGKIQEPTRTKSHAKKNLCTATGQK